MEHTSQRPFFSIIVPAHNEERYILKTLSSLADLEYPKERHEVIVVENGSTDATLSLARSFAQVNFTIITREGKGVSSAKNVGIQGAAQSVDWIILLDADTILLPDFLTSLADFLTQPTLASAVIGTTEVMPDRSTLVSRAWFAFYNTGHKLTKTSYAIQIMKGSLRDKGIAFDPKLKFAEDIKFIEAALHHGTFFYFSTKSVCTSVRRFEAVGWWKLFALWIYQALVLSRGAKRFGEYKVIR